MTVFILKSICRTCWSIQLRWRNQNPISKQQIRTSSQTSPWISTGSSSVAGKNRCGSKKSFKVAEVLAPGQASLQPASISQGVSGPILPMPPAPSQVRPARRAAHGDTAVCGLAASLPRPSRLSLSLLPAVSGGMKAVCCARGCHLQNKAGVGCQKVVSRNSKTLNLDSIPYTWWVSNWGKKREIYCINMF